MRVVGIVVFLMANSAYAANLYKCEAPDGSITYQQTQCAASAKRHDVDIVDNSLSDADYGNSAVERQQTQPRASSSAESQSEQIESNTVDYQKARLLATGAIRDRAKDVNQATLDQACYNALADRNREERLASAYQSRGFKKDARSQARQADDYLRRNCSRTKYNY